MQPVPVICDVDTGIDDAMALLLAVRHPGIDLRAVTCVVGNASLDQVVANTLYVLDAAGAGDVPVARGAGRPLLAPAQDAGHVHGADGLGGFSRPSDRRISALSAIELLRRELLAAIATGERITVVPLAPMTNIALLLRTYPEVAPGIERIVFMGGAAGPGNATAVAEFNVWHDPEAAAMTLAAAGELAVPVTMYGLDVFNDVVVDGEDAATLRATPDAGAQLAGGLIDAQRAVYGSEAITIGDAGAVCAVIDPDGIGTARYPVRVELGTGLARGQTIVDRRSWAGDRHRDPHGPGTPVDVALTVDAARFAELWLDTVGG
jgi:pyrimidine-specific ribonucleoside hydrolase